MAAKNARMKRRCHRKAGYSKMRADSVARISGQRTRKYLAAYLCPFCHRYHVGGTMGQNGTNFRNMKG